VSMQNTDVVNTAALTPGTYMISIRTVDGAVQIEKFVVH
jgi:hypothetical protein